MAGYPYTPFPFNVTLASPPFELSPVASNVSQGWAPSCLTPECVPAASWSTSSVGATLSFQFWGWDVAFYGKVKGIMSVEVQREGVKETWAHSGDVLFTSRGQPTDYLYSYNITLKVLDASPGAELIIDRAQVNGSSFADIPNLPTDRWVIPSNDTNLSYKGFVQQPSVAQAGSPTTFLSSNTGDTASMRFNASTFLIHGPCGPTNGLMKVAIDGRESTVNTSKPIASNDCLLFQARGFPSASQHQLLVENVDGGVLGIDRIEFFKAYSMMEAGNSSSGTKSAGIITGISLAVVLTIVVLALFLKSANLSKGGRVSRGLKFFCS